MLMAETELDLMTWFFSLTMIAIPLPGPKGEMCSPFQFLWSPSIIDLNPLPQNTLQMYTHPHFCPLHQIAFHFKPYLSLDECVFVLYMCVCVCVYLHVCVFVCLLDWQGLKRVRHILYPDFSHNKPNGKQ